MRFNLFQTISENVINTFISEENKYFNEQFNEYLKIEDALFCYQMIEEGYKPSISNFKVLNKVLTKKLENNQYKYSEIVNIKSLNIETKFLGLLKEMPDFNSYTSDFLNKNKEFKNERLIFDFLKTDKNKEMIINYIKDYTNYIKQYYQSGLDSTSDFYLKSYEENNQVKRNVKGLVCISSFLVKKDLLDQKIIQEIQDSFKSVSELMEKVTRDSYKPASFDRIGKDIIDSFIREISVYQINFLNTGNKKEDLLRRLKSRESRKKLLEEEMSNLIINKEYSIDNLPKESKDKVDRITKLVKSLNNSEVTEFVQERLPIIVKKYLSIDEDYRTSLKNVEGFNAQELMEQSLDNIEKIILAKKEDNNIELITEMSVENRKLKYKTIN